MMFALVVVSCTSKAVCQSVREATASGVDNAASPTGDAAERDYFTLQREADHYAKNNWKEPRSILMSSAVGVSMGNSAR